MIDTARLAELVENRVVFARRHPTLPLTIYNYSPQCQYDRLWCDTSLQCRGLVIDDNGMVVARPFRKFFNDGEHKPEEIPWHLPSEVTEKLDGSLLIVFWYGASWHAATRGSFDSEQAARGLEILKAKYGTDSLCPGFTYLFEVIYPGNRIVVDYGNREDVVLLGIIASETGREHSLDLAPPKLTVVRRLPPTSSFAELRALIRDGEEGYVVRFANGFRVKVKGEHYVRLHRILSGISSRSVWECLSEGKPLDEILAVIPDEFAQWVKRERDTLTAEFLKIMFRANLATAYIGEKPARKDLAANILMHYKDVAPVAFALLDNKRPEQAAWKLCYPDRRVPEKLAELTA